MTLRADLIRDRVRAVADSETRKEADEFRRNHSFYPSPNSARLDERHRRRVQTLDRVLSERISAERDLSLADDDKESWYEVLCDDVKTLIDDGFTKLRYAAQSDYSRGFRSGIQSGTAELLSDDQIRLGERYAREARIIQRERQLLEKTGRETSVKGVNVNIHGSTIAALNVDSAVGDIQASVNVLNTAGQPEVAEALKRLAEVFAEAHVLTDPQKREAVELLASLGDELTRPSEERRSSSVRTIARRVLEIARSVSDAHTFYEALRAAIRAATNIEIPV